MPRYFGLIPAAGIGARMGSEAPKQYLDLLGRPMIGYAIECLCRNDAIDRVFVVLSPEDAHWPEDALGDYGSKLEVLRCGGSTRAGTVLNGLRHLNHVAQGQDWVLVHDAARPCLSSRLLATLLREAGEDDVGGLLAVPVADTLKRADPDERVAATVPREHLWAAQTPQMFRLGVLIRALESMEGQAPTDESAAVERLGFRPRLIPGDIRNLKVTYPRDLELARLILEDGHE
ncbi:MAG: 2-C-methyl-D-erythritol 4-phosphate cytidylyltransferase [Betaproteobacteria bacterium]|nr:2-C-methyl-D-erythritol 4-phosphate cytidylyltransferase [Betaproteobacteria bacterium]